MSFMLDSPGDQEVLEDLRRKLAKEFGITMQGHHICLRWDIKKTLVDVSLLISECTTREEAKEDRQKMKRMDDLRKRCGKKKMTLEDWEAEMYYVEEGEYPK